MAARCAWTTARAAARWRSWSCRCAELIGAGCFTAATHSPRRAYTAAREPVTAPDPARPGTPAMSVRYAAKALVIGILMLVLLIPLGLINATIKERGNYRQEAVTKIAESYAGSQVLGGPVLV